MSQSETINPYIDHTRRWIEQVVIGLNLCPFARQPQEQETIRYVLSEAKTPKALLLALEAELKNLAEADINEIETTVLIHPMVLQDFYDYNLFLGEAERLLESIGLAGVIQIASMHPRYQFADTHADDAENYTNRSPYPLLHLIREQSIDEALSRYQQPERIPERNIRVMEKYGAEKMQQLLRDCMDEGE